MGIRHASQIAKDAELKSNRKLRRAVRMKERSLAAIQAAIELENCVEFSVAVERAKAAGASLDMIGACCGDIQASRLQKVATSRVDRRSRLNPEFFSLRPSCD
jgi:hypothetical protein